MNYRPGKFDTTLTGMLHKLKMIQLITDNIGNTSTVAYKRQIPESLSFESVLNQTAMRDNSQGQIKKSTSKFDLAIEGNAYFLVESDNGLIPTKNGRLQLNEKGELVNLEGQKVIVVEKTDKDINLAKESEIHINQNGEIFIGTERYGRIAMQILDNKSVKVHQGYIEGSNVNLTNEMVSLAMAFRAFEASEKILGLESSVDKDLIEKYGRNV